MEGEQREPAIILEYALKASSDVTCANLVAHKVGADVQPFDTKWSKPRVSFVKINTDAGRMGVLGCGIGVVCRDELGEVLAPVCFNNK